MGHKRFRLGALLILGSGLTGLQAQTMYVKQSNGTQTDYALSNIQKISFSSGNLTVTKNDNTNVLYALNNLRYFNFTDLSTNMEEPLSVRNQTLSVYPNPVSNVLNINLTGTAHEDGTLSIFNFEGKTVLNRQVGYAGVLSLDLSHLPKGLYLCRYANLTETRTVKIIKQ
jgi:hypothetical protein